MNGKKYGVRVFFSSALLLSFLLLPFRAGAEDINELESKSKNLETQISGVNEELLTLNTQIEDTESQITATDEEMMRLQDSLAISRGNEKKQQEDMAQRIQYMYENDSVELLNILCSASSMADFLNKADFIQNISDYDRAQLENLRDIRTGIEIQEQALAEEQKKLDTLSKDLEVQKAALETRAAELNADLNAFRAEIQRQRSAEAERAAKAAQAAADAYAAQQVASSGSTTASTGGSTGGSADSGGYSYSSGGALTPWKGVVYFNGHRETYYSQKVLPGAGLQIPGRHVASDGTVRDADNYICVASSDYPKGTVVETSLGTGKVYDCGCASGTIDIYTDW